MSSPSDPPAANMVIALYRPKEGQDAALRALIDRHMPCLREQGLVTDRPFTLLRASDGAYLEIFEWKPGGAHAAHENAAVQEIWGAMMDVADFPALDSLPEAGTRFPHFMVVGC